VSCIAGLVSLSAVAIAATTTGTDVKVDEDALSEVMIDVNPTDPANLVVVGHDALTQVGESDAGLLSMNTFFSKDGGDTWQPRPLGDAADGYTSTFRFDPGIVFDPDGIAYVAYGAHHGSPQQTTLVVARSTDGGDTWGTFRSVATNPYVGVPGNDRWTLAAGPDHDGTGNRVYVAWTRNVQEGVDVDQQIVVSSSGDAGNTWSAPVIVNDGSVAGADEGNLTALPAVGSDGELYLAWHDFSGDSGTKLMFDHSTDGGQLWGADTQITISAVKFAAKIPPQNDRGITPLGSLQVDRSGGDHDGRVYLAYTDTSGLPDTDIFVRYTDDLVNWSSQQVNDDTGSASQFLPALTVDQATGLLAAVWYDARDDPNNRAVHVYSSVSHDGGGTWQPSTRVADAASDLSDNNPPGSIGAGTYGGDFLEYIGVAAWNCQVIPVWSDNRETAAGNGEDLDYFVDRLTVTGEPCVPQADVSIQGFEPVAPPALATVGQPTQVTLRTTIANKGPTTPVDVSVSRSATAPEGATITPTSPTTTAENVVMGQERTLDETFTVTCTAPGSKTLTFMNTIAPVGATDPVTSDNSATRQVTLTCVVPVAVNIKPHGFPNSINLSGQAPTAVLTTRAGEYALPIAFDATAIDPASVRFGPAQVVLAGGGAPALLDKGHIEDSYELDEKRRDRDLDLVLQFGVSESGLTTASTRACVRGSFRAGGASYPFFGCDSVRVSP
jgi:hypothetical protein